MNSYQQKLTYVGLLIATAIATIAAYLLINWKQVIFKQAETKLEKQQFNDAILLYQQAIQAGFKQPRAYLHLADAYTANGQFQEAADWYKQYLTLKPTDQQARLKLARVLSYAGNYQESVEEYKKARQSIHEK